MIPDGSGSSILMIDYFEIATSACGLLAMTIPIYDLLLTIYYWG
jgi:hypothetical protein